MNLKLAAVLLTSSVTLCVLLTLVPLHAQARSVADGVYTQEQADRGKQPYASKCASCHGSALTGGELAPALVGGTFMSNWTGLTAGDLLDRIRTTMPQDTPGSLSAALTADILAFMFSANAFPPGQTELTKDTSALTTIKLEPK